MVKCNKCGYENKEGNNYCANCSAKLNSGVDVERQRTEMSQQTKIFLGIILCSMVFSLIGAGIWWLTIRSAPGMSQATFTFIVESDTEWSGAFGTLEEGQRTESGYGSASFTFSGSIASACVQKMTDYGYLTVKILRNGQLVASQSTSAPYGVVAVSASS
jgi:hypothetical protein